MKLKERIASSAANILVRKPGTIFIVLLVLIVLSLVSASRLTINTNQLDLISQRIVEIKDLKRAINMLGGVGHLLLALRGDDEEKLKKVSDDIYERFVKDKKNFRKITYKVDVSFAKSRVSMFVKTPDLKEVRKRVMLKLNDVLRRSDPFFFEIEETKPYKLKLEHIVQKYRKVGKKSITDDYYISQDRHMILLIIKPMWDANQLGKTGTLLKKIRTDLAAYTKSNKHGIKLMEDYSFAPDKNKSVIEYGFTGSYKTNYDDSFSIRNSLLPTSGFAIIGILLVLLIFLRRNFGAVVLVLSGLLVGILLTFGYAYVTIGQLNMITSILAGILMGQGIDFGIHFIYRIREELGRQDSVEEAVRLTVINSGIASFVSATAIGAAFFALCFSEFRGFSQFGFLAGSGVFLIGLVLYTWVPGILLLLARWKPELPKKIVGTLPPIEANKSGEEKRIPRPRLILAIAGVVILSVVSFAPKVYFNYNSRALMVENQPSVVLQDEIDRRFQISADPVAVFAKDLKEAKKLYKELTNKPKKYDTIDQVVSLYTFIPPYKQQVANAKILKAWEKEILAKGIKVASLPPKFRKRYPEMLKHLRTQPYKLSGVPLRYHKLFKSVASARPENQGYLTFLYPSIDVWDGKQLLKFADQIAEIKTDDGTIFRSAGLQIVFSRLSKIVIWDGKFSVVLTAFLLLMILFLDFRSIKETMVALIPLFFGLGFTLGFMALMNWPLNFMNIVVFPMVLGYGISHGVYFMHRFNEGSTPYEALRSVGTAVMCSTLTTLAGWAALVSAAHKGLQSMGILACVGMSAALLVSFTVMPAVLQLMHDRRKRLESESNKQEVASS